MPVDQPLIDEAMQALDVQPVRSLRDGAQKTVRLVRKADVDVVLKVIAIDSTYPAALRRAQREVELLHGINDPHVVRVASDLVELGDPPRGAAWLEEYLDGNDLNDLLDPAWTWEEAAVMARDVAEGLGAIHAVNVAHRDLSANNVRRLTNGSYVVMDPGFARHPLRSDLTIGGQPGTPGYASPEHLGSYSGAPTPASDVFCVGILMFRVLTGQLPIPLSGDDADYLARLSKVEVEDLDSLRPDLPDELKALIRRCLHPQPARRPRNGQRLREAIEALS